jgi:hypothetical protein
MCGTRLGSGEQGIDLKTSTVESKSTKKNGENRHEDETLLCGAEGSCGCVAIPTQLRMAGPQTEVGKRGRISGLSARSDLNGKLGDVIRWIPNKDRWAIVVVDSKEKVLVRKDCIDFDYTDGNAPTPSLEGYTDAGPAMPVAGSTAPAVAP